MDCIKRYKACKVCKPCKVCKLHFDISKCLLLLGLLLVFKNGTLHSLHAILFEDKYLMNTVQSVQLKMIVFMKFLNTIKVSKGKEMKFARFAHFA